MGGASISGWFILHVRTILHLCLKEQIEGKTVRRGINGSSMHALPAYVSAVTAVEAYTNEILLGSMARAVLKHSALWNLGAEWLSRLEVGPKLVVVPQLLFGRTLPRDESPFQDMATLIRVRNDLVHFKMDREEPKYIGPLANKGVFLKASGDAHYPWPDAISCSEGVRWAHNTACRIVQRLVTLATDDFRQYMTHLAGNFNEIPEADIRTWYEENHLDPESDKPTTAPSNPQL